MTVNTNLTLVKLQESANNEQVKSERSLLTTILFYGVELEIDGNYYRSRPATFTDPPEDGFIDDMKVFFQDVDVTPLVEIGMIDEIHEKAMAQIDKDAEESRYAL